jgi:hypothetical protein
MFVVEQNSVATNIYYVEREALKLLLLVGYQAIHAISKIACLQFSPNTRLCPLTYPLFIATFRRQ